VHDELFVSTAPAFVPAQLFVRRGGVGEYRPMYYQTPYRAVLSPCIGICTMGDAGLCQGCLRTGDEIARWSQMGDDERLRLMEHVLPTRECGST
jgi:uncharacterized protein